jgi:hypothetical protein
MSNDRFSSWGEESEDVEPQSFGDGLDSVTPEPQEKQSEPAAQSDSGVDSICDDVRSVADNGGGSVGCPVSSWGAVRAALEAEGYSVSYRDNKIHV